MQSHVQNASGQVNARRRNLPGRLSRPVASLDFGGGAMFRTLHLVKRRQRAVWGVEPWWSAG